MIGSLGVFIADDLLSFYLVYALVSIPAWGMIVLDDGPESKRAGGVYMAFAILGEALLLIAFAMLAAGAPNGGVAIPDVVAALPASPWRDAAIGVPDRRLRRKDGPRSAERLDAARLIAPRRSPPLRC